MRWGRILPIKSSYIHILLQPRPVDRVDSRGDPAPVLNRDVVVEDVAQLIDDVVGRHRSMLGKNAAGGEPYLTIGHVTLLALRLSLRRLR